MDINPASYPCYNLPGRFRPGECSGHGHGAISCLLGGGDEWNVVFLRAKHTDKSLATFDSPYLIYQYGFNPAATNWNNLTITGTNATIGSQASSALTGNITGAGLVVAHNDASGSDMNFQNFEIITNQAVVDGTVYWHRLLSPST